MCELLGLSFNRNIRPRFSFASLLAGSGHNCHGWGFACYPHGSHSACLLKEPVQGNTSDLSRVVARQQSLASQTLVCHIRRTSGTPVCYDNTHPFNRFYCRREWIFAHNGSLNVGSVGQLKFFPVGHTDSELAFCHLLSEMSRMRIKTTRKRDFIGLNNAEVAQIHGILKKINRSGSGSFNCLFSDGRLLFAYRDRNGARPLHYLRRERPFEKTVLRDSELEIDFRDEKQMDEVGFVVASVPLSSEGWVSFAPGELRVFEYGRMIYESH